MLFAIGHANLREGNRHSFGEQSKVSALLFDKIVVPDGSLVLGDRVNFENTTQIPKEVTFSVEIGSDPDTNTVLAYALAAEGLASDLVADETMYLDTVLPMDHIYHRRFVARFLSKLGQIAIPIYDSKAGFDRAFSEGKVNVYDAILNNIPVVSPGLTWEQVLEFRKDYDSVAKYRALRLWLKDSLKADTTRQAADIIGARLTDYEWAVKKHGLKTVQGVLTQVVDAKDFAAASVGMGVSALASAPIFGLIGGTGYLLAKGALAFRQHGIDLIDYKRGNAAIAMIHEIKELVREGD